MQFILLDNVKYVWFILRIKKVFVFSIINMYITIIIKIDKY